MSNNEENSMITPDSTDALDLLVGAITSAKPGDKDFIRNNYPIIEKYAEIVNSSSNYTPEEKERILKSLPPSRELNQLNAEDLAKYAKNINRAMDYLLDDREMEK